MGFLSNFDPFQGKRFYSDSSKQAAYDAEYNNLRGHGMSAKDADNFAHAQNSGMEIFFFMFTPSGWSSLFNVILFLTGAGAVLYPTYLICHWISHFPWSGFWFKLLEYSIYIVLFLTVAYNYVMRCDFLYRWKSTKKYMRIISYYTGWVCFISFWSFVIFKVAKKFI